MREFKVTYKGNKVIIEPLYECMILSHTTYYNEETDIKGIIKKIFRLRNDFIIKD